VNTKQLIESIQANISTGFADLVPEGGFKMGELTVVVGTITPPGGYKSDFASYLLRKRLETATPEEATLILAAYEKSQYSVLDFEMTPEMRAKLLGHAAMGYGLTHNENKPE
jgi:hypothetical protein